MTQNDKVVLVKMTGKSDDVWSCRIVADYSHGRLSSKKCCCYCIVRLTLGLNQA